MALAISNYRDSEGDLDKYYYDAENLLVETRPTAVNLVWAVKRMRQVFQLYHHQSLSALTSQLWQEASDILREDVATNENIGEYGQDLLAPGTRILTICNAGALATCGYGTALGVIRSAHQRGKISQVWACETRPVLQGARLTIWELMQDQIPVTLITDNMAGYVMQQANVDAVIVGADRVAANGDTANKIGTYSLAVLARYHQIPFYVAAPISTIDVAIAVGQDIPIEERNQDEVRQVHGRYITVPEVKVYNPAFDVTPAELISAIITEKGVITAPYREGIKMILRKDA